MRLSPSIEEGKEKRALSASSFCGHAILEEQRGKNKNEPFNRHYSHTTPRLKNTCSRWIHKYTRRLPLWCQGEPIREQSRRRGCLLTPPAGQGARILLVGLSQLPKKRLAIFQLKSSLAVELNWRWVTEMECKPMDAFNQRKFNRFLRVGWICSQRKSGANISNSVSPFLKITRFLIWDESNTIASPAGHFQRKPAGSGGVEGRRLVGANPAGFHNELSSVKAHNGSLLLRGYPWDEILHTPNPQLSSNATQPLYGAHPHTGEPVFKLKSPIYHQVTFPSHTHIYRNKWLHSSQVYSQNIQVSFLLCSSILSSPLLCICAFKSNPLPPRKFNVHLPYNDRIRGCKNNCLIINAVKSIVHARKYCDSVEYQLSPSTHPCTI